MLIAIASLAAALTQPSAAQTGIPVRKLSEASATTAEPLGLILGIKHLSDGRVLVNDPQALRLVMFDQTFTKATVVADTLGAGVRYGPNPTPLISYLGDSSLLMDRRALSFQLLDGNGREVRSMAIPKAADAPWIWGGRVLVDSRGRLVYRGFPRGNPPPDTGQRVLVTHPPDSAPIVRADFDTRTLDTLGKVRLQLLQEERRVRSGGPTTTTVLLFGASWIDDWVMTSSDDIAIVRGQDYHIDWISPSLERTSTPKMPMDWRRVSDEDKQRIADSAAQEVREFVATRRRQQEESRNNANNMRIVARADIATGTIQVISYDAVITSAPLERIPDYEPPLRVGAVKADRAGNVWIVPTTSKLARPGILVYDVINRQGQIFERVEMPAERSIVDFGPGGVVYTTFKDAGGAWRLERRTIVR